MIFRLVPKVSIRRMVGLGTDKSLLLTAGGVTAAGILKSGILMARRQGCVSETSDRGRVV